MQHKLHIVSFDVPYPPDYGGAIDVFYKIRALHEQGCKIYLHCYAYGRAQADALHKYCEEVWYYKRTTGIKGVSFSKPYIVSSRCSEDLLKRLKDIDAPILFEGIHTTFFLNHPSLKDRYKAIRIHNIEHEYYCLLAQRANSVFEKIYFKVEASLLKKYEHRLNAAQAFYALSFNDHLFFKALYPNAVHTFIPPFHQYREVNIREGIGDYCLYHGNLSHPENIEAALFLLTKVFPSAGMPVVIAGKNPVPAIVAACEQLADCRLIANPDRVTMDELIANAHIHVLTTFQQSGVKLKLLSAVYAGRHLVLNKEMLFGTTMPHEIGSIAHTETEFVAAIRHLRHIPFTDNDIQKRKAMLKQNNNNSNAAFLLKEIINGSNNSTPQQH